jgi:hypothetical protein
MNDKPIARGRRDIMRARTMVVVVMTNRFDVGWDACMLLLWCGFVVVAMWMAVRKLAGLAWHTHRCSQLCVVGAGSVYVSNCEVTQCDVLGIFDGTLVLDGRGR